MKRVAILSQLPLDLITGSGHLGYFMRLFKKLGMHVELFSMSTVDKTEDLYGFKQNQVSLPSPDHNATVPARMMDAMVLGTLGFKPRMELMSRSKRFTDALHRYNPDLIFLVDTIFAKTLKRYKREDPRVKIIAYTDAPSNEFNFALTKSISSANQSSAATRYLTKILKKNYLKYQSDLYRTMIDVSDAFVVPAKVHVTMVLKSFPNARGKIFSVMGNYVTKDRIIKGRRATKIKKILFLSTYGPAQINRAMDTVEREIAPQFPDKQFIMHGKHCPERKSGNVIYSGKYLPLKKLFADIDLCICPLPDENTGYKVKVFDYFLANKIVMATTNAFLGFNVIDGYNAVVENDMSKYPDRIRQLEGNKRLMARIQRNAHTALKGHYERDAIKFWSKIFKRIGIF